MCANLKCAKIPPNGSSYFLVRHSFAKYYNKLTKKQIMKKQIITLFSLSTLLVSKSYAQFGLAPLQNPSTQTTGGDVGIGTGTPNSKLDVLSTGNQLRLSNSSTLFNNISTNSSGYLTVIPSNATTSRIGFNIAAPLTGFHINMGVFRVSDPSNSVRSLQVAPNYAGNGEIPQGTLLLGTSTASSEGLSFISTGGGTAGVKIGAYAYTGVNGWKSVWESANVSSGSPNLLLLKSGGKVGIGTALPVAKLEINATNLTPRAFQIIDGSTSLSSFIINPNGNTVMGKHVDIGYPLGTNISSGANIGLGVFQNTPNNIATCSELRSNTPNAVNTLIIVDRDDQEAISMNKWTSSGFIKNFVVRGNGATYIGTQKPFGNHADAMLSVDGKALFKSIYVSTSAAVWADYVFENDYKLMPLSELEAYYKTNKHLPEIPSASDVAKEQIDVAKMETLLLKKIEELTLYIVQLEKEIKKTK
jgi:hypothetical protein